MNCERKSLLLDFLIENDGLIVRLKLNRWFISFSNNKLLKFLRYACTIKIKRLRVCRKKMNKYSVVFCVESSSDSFKWRTKRVKNLTGNKKRLKESVCLKLSWREIKDSTGGWFYSAFFSKGWQRIWISDG